MINHELLRTHMRLYSEADSEVLRQAMERSLMDLLQAQAEFEKQYHHFVAATLAMLRNKT